ncbi:receptor-like protein kinase 5 [Hordeum vulgare]|nr:receptor-like protein kinase 5 [Hordeum vulgare]
MSIIIRLLFRYRKDTQVVKEVVADWKMTPFTPPDFVKSDLLNNIPEENIMGNGGPRKICNTVNLDHKQFNSEVETLGGINHKNIIKLLCIISSQDAKLLVYEHMEKGSLDDWPHRHDRMGTLVPLD